MYLQFVNKLMHRHTIYQSANITHRSVFKRTFYNSSAYYKSKIDVKDFSNESELGDGYVPGNIENKPLGDSFFKPPLKSNRDDVFTMILPPPNITGTLHLGHALTATIQDVMIKWRRMCGIDTAWIPGMDHAGIATQVIVEKRIWSESRRSRHDLGRDEFEREVWKWKGDKSNVIGGQLRRLGVSLDWDRDYFTMSADHSRAVTEAFVRLSEAGLIYEADALVNWCCTLQSAISDIEVERVEVAKRTRLPTASGRLVEVGLLTSFLYKFEDDCEHPGLPVATTRPETILGDVAVAVHPDDARYNGFIGRRVMHPFRNISIPVIGDSFVDRQFGTGVVKVTPAHDTVDFEVAKRHSLIPSVIFDENGQMVNCGAPFDGLDRFDARTKVLDSLQNLGLLVGQQDHAMSVPVCSRSQDIVELLIKPQWFVKCSSMAEKALRNVREGNIVIDPESFNKIWDTYLGNIRDWCISRQLWWGHRIPAFRFTADGASQSLTTVVARNTSEARLKASQVSGKAPDVLTVRQVDDVLDTWFSSALIPLSVCGWPDESFRQSRHYPLSIMETGNDIVFFWVARMVMLCSELTGRAPFDRVLLHGILCDSSGRKMSKSLGNVISPEDVIEGRTLQQLETATKATRGLLSKEEMSKAIRNQRKMFPDGIAPCGTDPLRFTLCSHNFKNRFINFDVQECKTNKFFGNKIWQATKFALKWSKEMAKSSRSENEKKNLSDMDRWILSRLSHALSVINEALTNNNLYKATGALKNFIHYELCDVYLEYAKRGLKESNSTHCDVLVHCLRQSLRALAPFMPYLSQHLHEHLEKCVVAHPSRAHLMALFGDEELLNGRYYYPQPRNEHRDIGLERRVSTLMDIVTGIRRLRKVFHVTGKQQPQAVVSSDDEWLAGNANVISDLAGCTSVEFGSQVALLDADYVSERIDSLIRIHLRVPEESRRNFEVDARKLEARRAKLIKELDDLRANESGMERIAAVEEKISRIDLIRDFQTGIGEGRKSVQ